MEASYESFQCPDLGVNELESVRFVRPASGYAYNGYYLSRSSGVDYPPPFYWPPVPAANPATRKFAAVQVLSQTVVFLDGPVETRLRHFRIDPAGECGLPHVCFLKSQRRFVLVSFVGLLAGRGESGPNANAPKKVVYVDAVTVQPVVHDIAASFPAAHPTTGKLTLRPALFCPTCQKWYPVPPPNEITRVPGAGKCPKDKKTLLIADGPWPDGSGSATKSAGKP